MIDHPVDDLAGELLPRAETERLQQRPIVLDRHLRVQPDEGGDFEVSSVEAGVNVAPGETVHVTWDDIVPEGRVQLRYGKGVAPRSSHGVLFGLEQVFSIGEFGFEGDLEDGNPGLGFRRQRKGSYMLYTRNAQLAFFRIDGENAVADLGSAGLTQHTSADERYYLVPDHLRDNAIVLRLAEILPREPEQGIARFEPLPAGRYAVGVVGKGFVATVDVLDASTELRLP